MRDSVNAPPYWRCTRWPDLPTSARWPCRLRESGSWLLGNAPRWPNSGFRALVGGTIAALMTAAVAGILPVNAGTSESGGGLIVAGTVTLDWVEGTARPAEAAIGGSAIYAAIAALSVGTPTAVEGVVGTDYPMERLALLEERRRGSLRHPGRKG